MSQRSKDVRGRKAPILAGIIAITVGMLLIGPPLMKCATHIDVHQRYLDICVDLGIGFVSSGCTFLMFFVLWEAGREYEDKLERWLLESQLTELAELKRMIKELQKQVGGGDEE